MEKEENKVDFTIVTTTSDTDTELRPLVFIERTFPSGAQLQRVITRDKAYFRLQHSDGTFTDLPWLLR